MPLAGRATISSFFKPASPSVRSLILLYRKDPKRKESSAATIKSKRNTCRMRDGKMSNQSIVYSREYFPTDIFGAPRTKSP